MEHSILFKRLLGELHNALLDEIANRNHLWYRNIPYSFLSEKLMRYNKQKRKED
jgi:hypothetical protein